MTAHGIAHAMCGYKRLRLTKLETGSRLRGVRHGFFQRRRAAVIWKLEHIETRAGAGKATHVGSAEVGEHRSLTANFVNDKGRIEVLESLERWSW